MFRRISENPFLTPDPKISWEAAGAFNPCILKDKKKFHLLYRALSQPCNVHDVNLAVSSIGYAISEDGIRFNKVKQLIKPEHHWEIFGCEDPRITKLDDKYYIFYTALSSYPFSADGIRIGLAITSDLTKIESKHLVTTFNSKAMAIFPEKINGRLAAILTVHTDIPPAKIALAFFDREEQMWSTKYWNGWYSSLDHHVIPLLRDSQDHLEVGAPPIKTEAGWLLIYSYIKKYLGDEKIFGIEAVLLDLNEPSKVIGRTQKPLLIPEKKYELIGNVPNVIFPSGAVIEGEDLLIYYGAADTSCCVAVGKINELLAELTAKSPAVFATSQLHRGFKRYNQNPIIAPRPEFAWEAKATFNPGAIYEAGRVHIIYRAMSHDDTSVWGYAASSDGMHIDERLPEPIYQPREIFSQKLRPGNSGCEDPRITKIDDRFYVFYTAFDGYTPRVAFTSIKITDFLSKWWNWDPPKVISSPLLVDKNAGLLSEKINGKYVIFHRIEHDIYIDYVDELTFSQERWLPNKLNLLKATRDANKNIFVEKIGISAPPIKTKYGWLLFYHWVISSKNPCQYNVGAALLQLDDPSIVLKKDVLLMEPETDYEKIGIKPDIIFPCGAVLIKDEIFLYYGGADKVIGVAKIGLKEVVKMLGI